MTLPWTARVASWVLSAFATLAILGAIASVSDTARRTTGPDGPPPAIVDPAAPPDVFVPPPGDTAAARSGPRTVTPAAATALATRSIAGWLEALTYAVLALVAVAGVGAIALFRIAARMPPR